MTRTTEPLTHFEERLLAELKLEVMGRQPAARPAKSRSPRPRRVMVAAAIGVSAAVAAGLTVATTAGAPAGTPSVRYSLAADFLNRAAAAARAQNAPLPRPDQVSYIEQLVVSPGPHGGIRECMVLWSPSPLTGLAGGAGGGKCGPGVPAVPTAALKQMRSPSKPSYDYPALNTLPTSPAALRAALYAAAARGGAAWNLPTVHSTDVIVSILIGNLLGVPLSGQLRASLYEVLAQMPGVTLVPNAVDAAGRHGTGVVMKWDYPGYGLGTAETIFAPGTYAVLGGDNIMPGQRVYFATLGSGLVTLPRS
jgi:hypothetical protein